MHIKEYMVKLGLRNKEMAALLGITEAWLSRIRSDKYKPSNVLRRHIEEKTNGHVKYTDWDDPFIIQTELEEAKGKNMKIEVQEFYPLQKMPNRGKIGTLHVYVEDLDMDIRGVTVYVSSNRYFIQLPSMFSRDKERVRFPCISFLNEEKQKVFLRELIDKGVEFMKNWKKMNDKSKVKKPFRTVDQKYQKPQIFKK